VEGAGNTREILAAVVQHLFGALLTAAGDALANYGPDRTLDPSEYAIPAPQWNAIASACQGRADAFGTRAEIALELINLMPDSYDDPTVTVPLRPTIDHRPREHVLTVTREATDVIAAASAYCDRLAVAFGSSSREYLDAVASWQRNVSHLFSMGFGADTRVSKDGELNLLVCSGSGLVYAIVFHPDQRRCTRPGCQAVIDDDGRAWTYRPEDPRCADDRHEPSYPLDVPAPGTWSLHS
jgi:hypothetical protein